MLRSHAQRVFDLLKNDKGRAEAVGKVGRDGGGNAGITTPSRLLARSGRWHNDSTQVSSGRIKASQIFPVPCGLQRVIDGWRRGCPGGPLPMGSCCSRNDGGGNGGWSCATGRWVRSLVLGKNQGREHLGAPPTSSGRSGGFENGGVRRKRSVNRSSFSCPPVSLFRPC